MRKIQSLIHSLLLVTSPSFFISPQYGHASKQSNFQDWPFANFNLTYDEILRLLHDVEGGRIKHLSEEELEKINHFLAYLAQMGMLPGEIAANADLQNDIAALFADEEDLYDFAYSYDSSYAYTILPALLNGEEEGSVLLCKHKKDKHRHKKKLLAKIKHFVKKHKKAIIIGAAIVIAATAVIIAVASAATAGAVAAAAAAPAFTQSDKKENSTPDLTNIPPEVTTALHDQLFSFKEKIVENQFFQPTDSAFWQQGLSWEENGRLLGSLFAHDSFNALQTQMPYSGFSHVSVGENHRSHLGHPEIDNKFSTDYTHLFTNPTQEANFNTLAHQVRGETALTFGYYEQAVHDFGKAIETNPTNPVPYLERGIAHFGLGHYENSLQDYQKFTTQKAAPLSVSDFSLGVAKGLPKGIYESGEGILLFFADFVTHPIQTSVQLIEATTALVHLARDDEWGMIAEALSPEMHQLITQWENLSSEQRGELAGYALGKLGTDIFAPGALVALAGKSIKCAQELAAIAKNLHLAQETLLLETAAGIGNSAKVAELVETGQKVAYFADELGLSTAEVGQLKQAGNLEASIVTKYEHLSPAMQESFALHQNAKLFLKPYTKKPMPEAIVRGLIHETGIPTFPRPLGIPEDFLVMLSGKGAGMEYVHPTNSQIRVRVMPGKPHSPNPSQQKPYVIQKTDRGALDKAGNYVSPNEPAAHIPFEEFIYRDLNGN